MRNVLVSSKNFVLRHRVAIAVVTTSTLWIMLHVRYVDVTNEFLKEHDLYDLYWATDEI